MSNYKDIIQEIDAEILGAKEALIKKAIKEELSKYQFNESNLSPTLISLFMQTKSMTIPIPEVKKMPISISGSADLEVLFPKETPSIYSDLMVGNNVYLYGKAGTGKTTLAKNIARVLLKRPSFVVNCNQFTSPINLIGGQTIEGYKQGGLSLAWEKGGVLILDELPKLDPNTAGLLNEALASSADDERVMASTAEEHDEYLERMSEEDANLDYEVLTREQYLKYVAENESVTQVDADFVKIVFVTITDGSGRKLRKNKYFCVIGTGNTDMKQVNANFSGNNRQDYSLVDRFAGSFYLIEYDKVLEDKLIYDLPLEISRMIRDVLDQGDYIESISLRTMLNFSRVYEQVGLKEIDANEKLRISEYKDQIKTLNDAVDSFIKTLPNALQSNPTIQQALVLSTKDIIQQEFIQEFEEKRGINPFTLEVI